MTAPLDSRRVAVELLTRVERDRSFLEPLLADRLARTSLSREEDRRLLTELAYGTLRLRNRMDWILNHFYRGKPSSLDLELRNIIRVGLYQLFCMDRVPMYAAVNEAVKMAKRRFSGREGLVNGILRNAARQKEAIAFPDFDADPLENLTWYHSHPAWLVRRWIALYGAEEARELCRANNLTPPLVLRLNRLKGETGEALRLLDEEGLQATPTRWSPDGLLLDRGGPLAGRTGLLEGGLFQAQDEASQMVSYILAPRPGEVILDLCSGAGIKATHMAAMMENRGSILAVDLNRRKLEMGRERARAMGVTIIESRHADALELPGDELRGRFDRVLVDAPCSGLGTVRRKPEIKWFAEGKDLRELSVLQGRLLQSCEGYLKPGGVLVYATCTMMPEENEKVVRAFLKNNPSFEIRRPVLPVDEDFVDGEGFFRTLPHRHGTDGFFAALLVKSGALRDTVSSQTGPSAR